MSDINLSAQMNLPIPIVGVDSGPDYALNLNSCLTIIDSHDHSAGSGVQITPSGMDINIDLPFGSNNATSLKSVRFTPQVSALSGPDDLGCLYEVAADLYYNDGAGNQVRITQSGGVAGSPGSISNLTSPASASYVSGNQTFVWQSAANTPANLDAGSVIFRNIAASSFGLTLNPPAAMGSNYALTLPSLPGSQKFMTLDAAGTMSAPWAVDGSTLEVATNVVQVKDGGITAAKLASNSVSTAKIVDLAVTSAKLAAPNFALSNSCGNFLLTASANVYTPVTNLSVTITASGLRPVLVALIPTGSGEAAFSPNTVICNYKWQLPSSSSAAWAFSVASFVSAPGYNFMYIDFPDPGVANYTFYMSRTTTSSVPSISNMLAIAIEL